jgi:hypothetical protein
MNNINLHYFCFQWVLHRQVREAERLIYYFVFKSPRENFMQNLYLIRLKSGRGLEAIVLSINTIASKFFKR